MFPFGSGSSWQGPGVIKSETLDGWLQFGAPVARVMVESSQPKVEKQLAEVIEILGSNIETYNGDIDASDMVTSSDIEWAVKDIIAGMARGSKYVVSAIEEMSDCLSEHLEEIELQLISLVKVEEEIRDILREVELAVKDIAQSLREPMENTARQYFNQGTLWFYEGEFEKSLPLLMKAAKANTTLHWAYHHLGHIYFSRKQYDKACRNFELAGKSAREPEHRALNFSLAAKSSSKQEAGLEGSLKFIARARQEVPARLTPEEPHHGIYIPNAPPPPPPSQRAHEGIHYWYEEILYQDRAGSDRELLKESVKSLIDLYPPYALIIARSSELADSTKAVANKFLVERALTAKKLRAEEERLLEAKKEREEDDLWREYREREKKDCFPPVLGPDSYKFSNTDFKSAFFGWKRHIILHPWATWEAYYESASRQLEWQWEREREAALENRFWDYLHNVIVELREDLPSSLKYLLHPVSERSGRGDFLYSIQQVQRLSDQLLKDYESYKVGFWGKSEGLRQKEKLRQDWLISKELVKNLSLVLQVTASFLHLPKRWRSS